MVFAKLICIFVFAYAKSQFSRDEAHIVQLVFTGVYTIVLNPPQTVFVGGYTVFMLSDRVSEMFLCP